MERLVAILRKAVSDGASDIFIVAGGALSYKVDGEIRPMEASAERLTPDDTKVLLDEIYECASREKTLLLVPGATHGKSFPRAPEQYRACLTALFDRALS